MSLTQTDFEYVRTMLRRSSAIDLGPDKAYLVEARLQPVAREEGFASAGDLVGRLEADPGALRRKVVEAMTTNETYFFRDTPAFEGLREHVLPELLALRRETRTLNIWSAGCSTGQEPYSIALLFREHFPAMAGWQVRILATDLSSAVVERGRAGQYGQLEVNRGLPAALLVKHFRRCGLNWQISDDLRARVEFRTLNLIDAWPALPPMDLVLLRNVLIYFDPDAKKQVLGRVRTLLRPSGCLVLGTAETTFNLDAGYEPISRGRFTCYRPRA